MIFCQNFDKNYTRYSVSRQRETFGVGWGGRLPKSAKLPTFNIQGPFTLSVTVASMQKLKINLMLKRNVKFINVSLFILEKSECERNRMKSP